MNFQQNTEKQININLIILGTKLKALQAVLTKEQLNLYHQILEEEKLRLQSELVKVLPLEQVDEVLKTFDI